LNVLQGITVLDKESMIETTVQEEDISFSTDSMLHVKIISKLNKIEIHE
jgi:hypothetical protein